MRELLPSISTPVMLIAGDFDKQCTVRGVRSAYAVRVPMYDSLGSGRSQPAVRSVQLLGSANKQLVVVGTKPLYKHHYGHLDLLVGKHVDREVFPHITSFLLELDDATFQKPEEVVRLQTGDVGSGDWADVSSLTQSLPSSPRSPSSPSSPFGSSPSSPRASVRGSLLEDSGPVEEDPEFQQLKHMVDEIMSPQRLQQIAEAGPVVGTEGVALTVQEEEGGEEEPSGSSDTRT
jgi:hypothetical protein